MKQIDMTTFRHLLSVHGTDLSRWPDVDVKNVLTFIDENEDAKAEFEQAGKLDAALALYDVPEFDAAHLMARISDAETAHTAEAEMSAHIAAGAHNHGGASRKFFWRAGMAFAACAALMVIGVTSLHQTRTPASSDGSAVVTVKTAAADDVNGQIDDLLVIAAKGYREQEQLQKLMSVLGNGNASSAQGSGAADGADDAVNNWLEHEFNTYDGQGLIQDFVSDNG